MGNYNNNWNTQAQYDYHQKRIIRQDANFAGLVAVAQTVLLQLVYIVLVFGLSAIGIIKPVDQYYGLGNTGFLLFYSIAYIIGVGFPAPIIAIMTHRSINPFSNLDTDDEKSPSFPRVVLALLAGLAVCIIANFITSYIVYFLQQIGIQPPEMPDYLENNIPSLLLNIVIFALLPAILEEMVYRGYILRILLPHGKLFAILISSMLFALMHGNILQIPFAFIVGLACGYLAVKTGSIWISVMLHFLNNFMSMLLQYTGINLTDQQNEKVILIVFSILGIVGLYALLALFAKDDPIVRKIKENHNIPASKRAGEAFTSPAIIASIVVSLILTVLNQFVGG